MDQRQDRTVLTAQGRKQLEERARRLREETIPALNAAMERDEPDSAAQVEHDRAVNELHRLTYLLETARSADDLPENPDTVEIGDWVTIVSEDETSRYLIVDPAEAGVDEDRISSGSPLAKAVLGRHVGDETEVQSPGGTYVVRIVEVLRDGR